MSTDRLTGTASEISTPRPQREYRLITVDLSDGERVKTGDVEMHTQRRADAAIAKMVADGWSIDEIGGMWGNRAVILFRRDPAQ